MTSAVHLRVVVAGTFTTITEKFDGIARAFQWTDADDLNYSSINRALGE